MGDNKQSPDDYERRRRLFLDEWETGVTSLDEEGRSLNSGAIKFAISGLRSLFLLNGGGVVVLPAYVVLFKVSVDKISQDLVVAALAFVVGLVLAAVANITAYFTMVQQVENTWYRREKAAHELEKAYWGSGVTQKSSTNERDQIDFPRVIKRTAVVSEALRWAAIALAIASLGAFLVGIYFIWSAFITSLGLKIL